MRTAALLLSSALLLLMLPSASALVLEQDAAGYFTGSGSDTECSFPFGDDQGIWVCMGGQKEYITCIFPLQIHYPHLNCP